jgi:pimeloyl-ACP methyl ester carboxylesterase
MPDLVANGRTFHYLEAGDGPVALFIHGYPFDATMWHEVMDDLGGLRRCIAVDLRGFGATGRTTRQVLTMEDHADDLAAFLVKASVVAGVDVVGLSMGGYVALAFAQRHPERIRSLALLDTKATPDSEEAKVGRDAAAVAVVRDGRSAFAASMVGAVLADQASLWVRARVRTMIEETPTETIVAALAGMRLRPDRTQVLAHSQVPAAVIVGEHDRLATLADAEHMVAAARARLTVVPGAGHLPPVEEPAAVVSALRALWLAE